MIKIFQLDRLKNERRCIGVYLAREISLWDVLKEINSTPEKTEIFFLMPNLSNTRIYQAVLKAGLRSSLIAMEPLTRNDFDTYDKNKPKETDEVPKIVPLRSGW